MKVTHKEMIHGYCPVDGAVDYYEVVIEPTAFVTVEEVRAALEMVRGEKRYQEDMAQRVHDILEGRATITLSGRHGTTDTSVTVEAA